MIEPDSEPEGTGLEVWVVGQPNTAQIGSETVTFPPYRFRWTDALARRHYGVETALEGAREFVQNRQADVTGEWDEGPTIFFREIQRGPWQEEKP